MSAHRILHDLFRAPHQVADPGDAAAIVITRQMQMVPFTTGASGETNTLAAPTKAGLILGLCLDVDGGGNRVVTVATAYDQAGSTTITLQDAGDFILLYSVKKGVATYVWRVLASDGVAGPTEQRPTMAAPQTATATVTLTSAQMLGGLLVATPTSAAAYMTLTGTQIEAALAGDVQTGEYFDLTIINLGGTGDDITYTAGADVTVVGDPVVGPVADVATEQMSSGTFRHRRSAANTFIAYRIA